MSTSTMERPAGYPSSLPPARPVRTPPPPPVVPSIPIPLLAGLTTLCTTLCLGNLFDGLRWWLLPSAGAIVLAGVVGECGRRIRTPLVVMPLLYVVAGWLYVIPVSTHGSSFSSRISLAPSPTTWSALRSLAQSGSNDIHSLTVPVPERPGFLFLTVAGVYVIAALVDAIAAGLKRPAAAGLPLLALLAVPAAVVERGVGLLAFAAACLSYVALLLESGRRSMTDWARLPPGSAPDIRRMTGAIGRRIGAVALVAALVVPVVIPRYTGIAHDHRGSGGGSGSATVIEPFVTLAQQVHSKVVEPLLTVHTSTPEYLRLTALEHFDGRSFTLGSLSATANERVSHGLPAAAGGATERVKATITVKPVLKQRYLPVPYQPTSVKVLGDWRLAAHNFTIFSAQTDTSGLTYTVTSQVPNPSPQELQAQSAGAQLPTAIQPSLQLPGNLPTDIEALSHELTDGYSTEYDKAAAIQAYLRGPLFTYDLNGAPSGPNALEDFLFSDRRGYCEQFAAAMVVLAREVGIPARVAVGFTPGTQQAPGTWLVTNHDAHSWPEIWFPQAGWVRFEPTKRDTSTDPPSYTLPPVASPSTPTPSASASTAPSPTASAAPSQPSARQSAEAAAAAAAGGGGGSSGEAIGWSAGALALVALLLTPFTVRRRRRRLRLTGGSGPAGTSGTSAQRWLEIVDTATDLGLDIPATLTPRRTVQHWAQLPGSAGQLPDASYAVLLEAAQAEELARYAGTDVSLDPAEAPPGSGRLQTALADWERAYGGWVRLRALFAPRSVLNPPAGRNRNLFAWWPRGRSGRTDRTPIDQT